jgi:uncharacterized protein YecA (UPF0149 family)
MDVDEVIPLEERDPELARKIAWFIENRDEIAKRKGFESVWVTPTGVEYVGRLVQEVPKNQAKVGRNDPCTCGSGKKFKKCCG